MDNQSKSFLAPFFMFHFITVFGIAIALFIYAISSEKSPVSAFIFSPSLYVLASLIAVSVRLFLWILVDKGTFFEISKIFKRMLLDILVINVVILSTLSSIFIVETFFL